MVSFETASAPPFPILLADIGGTNCRLALLPAAGAPPLPLATLASATISDLPQALRQALGEKSPRSAVFAIAGIVDEPRVTLTNLPWTIDAAKIGVALGLEAVLLVNDFEAQAASLAVLQDRDCLTLQEGKADPRATRLIAGAGTGFGAAFLHPAPQGFCIISGEAGHVDLPLEPGDEALFGGHMRARHGRLTVESVVSGPGLARLDAAMRASETARRPEAVAAAAEAGEAEALRAIAIWFRLLANALANLAIATKATGGIWIAGGMIARLLPFLDQAAFVRAATDKPPMRALMKTTPIRIVTRDDSAFLGLAAMGVDPLRFGLSRPPGLWLRAS